MTWVKLDDGFCDHPKIALLPIKSRWAHLHGLCYCNRFLTDGQIPIDVANRWEGAGACAVLVERGLWSTSGAFYVIEGYLDWNASRHDVEERRRADLERKAKGPRKESAKNPKEIPSHSRSGVEWSEEQEEEWFSTFYDESYPRKAGRRTAAGAFHRALQRAPASDIIAGAIRYRSDPTRHPGEFTAHPTTWLNRDGWLDEPEGPHPLAAVPDIDFEAQQRARIDEENRAIALLENEKRA